MSKVLWYLLLQLWTEQGFGNRECWDACYGSVYTGTLSVTVNGNICQSWSTMSPHTHIYDKDRYFPFDGSVLAASNYCRDPEGIGQPGCYTTNPVVVYEFCDVPICNYTCCFDDHNRTGFAGKLATTYLGNECKEWIYQTSPTNFNNDSLFPADGSAAMAKNYCRDPDRSGSFWCYVSLGNSSVRERCTVPKCNAYSFRCGGILTDKQGWISPLFLNSRQLVVCQWTVIVDDGHVVTAKIVDLKLLPSTHSICTLSVIKIYDGENENSNLRRQICHKESTRYNITSTSNAMHIIFTGLDTLRQPVPAEKISFNLTYSQAEAPEFCEETLMMKSGWFSSPDSNRDGLHERNANCWYYIVAADDLVVQFTLLDLDLIRFGDGCDFGFIEIYSGDDFTDYIGTYCTKPPNMITTRTNKLLVMFDSGDFLSDGFFALYSATVNRTEYYNGILNDEIGLLSVFSRWMRYITWTITARDGYMLRLTILSMAKSPDDTCTSEKIQVFDGTTSTDRNVVGHYCQTPPATITAKSQSMLFVYSNDFLEEEDSIRFVAMYWTIPRTNGTLRHIWPEGNYALPMSVYGCDDPETSQWRQGYVNISFREPVTIVNRNKERLDLKVHTLMAGPFGSRSYQMNFCSKRTNSLNHTITSGKWPPGNYAVYGLDTGCPHGLTARNVSRTVPEILRVNTDGYIPKMEFHTSESRLDFLLCHKRNSHDDTDTETFDYLFPFAVLSATWDKEKILNKSNGPYMILEEINIESTDVFGLITEYALFTYEIYVSERLNKEYRTKSAVKTKYKSWELGLPDTFFIHKLTSDQEPPYAPGWSDTSKNRLPEWLQFDLGQSMSLNVLKYTKNRTLSFIDGMFTALPAILISETKWSFLNHGAMECLQSVFRLKTIIEVSCLNGQPASAGRYITLILRHPPFLNILQRIMSRHWIILIIAAEKSDRCNQMLGLTDGSIGDFQISSSSAQNNYRAVNTQPYDSGWCANQQDSDPFIQVNLLLPTQIEGIQISNWWGKEGIIQDKRMGVYNFSIEFFTQNKMETDLVSPILTKVWSLDMSLPHENAQTFMLLTPILARHVRVRPLLSIENIRFRCLKFELIGCLRIERVTMNCSETDTETDAGRWFETKTTYIPEGNMEQNAVRDVPDSRACIAKCIDMYTRCSTIIYNKNNRTCFPFDYPVSQKYQTVVVDANKISLSRFCTEDRGEENTSSLYILDKNGWRAKTSILNNDIAVVSSGYPFHYLRGLVWSWMIDWKISTSVGIIFTDIDLNIYENQPFIRDQDRRYSDKVDRIHVWSTLMNRDILFSDQLINENLHFEYAFSVIEASFNNKTVHIRNCVVLFFRTWQIDTKLKHIGRGFRARVYFNDNTFCEPEISCTSPGYFGSESFMGEYANDDISTWNIYPIDHVYIILTFNEFDIRCNRGSFFQISYLSYPEEGYCNFNKPVRTVKSLGTRLKITFRHKIQASHLPEGFSTKYSFMKSWKVNHDEDVDLPNFGWSSMIDLSLFGDTLYSGTRQLGYSVCHRQFRKCYYLFEIELISWVDFQYYACELNGMGMVSIRSKEEKDYIRDLVLDWADLLFRHSNNIGEMYVFIGLRKRRLSNGRWRHEWINRHTGNRVVTFKDWEKGEPSLSSSKECTLMRIKLNEEQTWKSFDCYAPITAPFGFCEFSLDHIFNANEREPTHKRDVSVPSIFRDATSYFLCRNNEIISILGRCDGNEDCFDGSDEIGCDEDTDCGDGYFKCGDNQCVQMSTVCDHFPDCQDGTDENCYFMPCQSDQFRCNDAACIPLTQRCDTKNDCTDGSDEEDCAESICNNWRSLRCESRCIANSSICNGERDCLDGSDEENCPLPKTCKEWWEAGYTESGLYNVDGAEVECDFDIAARNGTIFTRYHFIDFDWKLKSESSTHQTMLLMYKDEEFLTKLTTDHATCYQSIDQLCTPAKQFLHDIENISHTGENELCQCKRYKKTFGVNALYLTECHGSQWESENVDTYISAPTKDSHYIQEFSIPKTSLHESLMIRINPVECMATARNDTNELDISCGQGLSADSSLRCLYDLDEFGNLKGCHSMAHLQKCEFFECPTDYFKCHESFCLEQRFVCDGEMQCRLGEDEEQCETRMCGGKYRCLNSSICLSVKHLCDGYRNCPYGDDERLCDFRSRCPEFCSCVGTTVFCRSSKRDLNTTQTNQKRIRLPSSVSELDINSNTFIYKRIDWSSHVLNSLIKLNLSRCGIKFLPSDLFVNMNNLKTLDLTYNMISTIPSRIFENQNYLTDLRLQGNMYIVSIETEGFTGLFSMKYLDLSFLQLGDIAENAFSSLTLEVLKLSSSSIRRIDRQAFKSLFVKRMFINDSSIASFSLDMYKGIERVDFLFSDAYTFCCIAPSYLPEENCFPKKELFSSCSDLIASEVMRPLMWLIALVGVLGNVSTLIFRIWFDRQKLMKGYSIILANLAISDFLMDLKILIIVSVDASIRGSYIFTNEVWRESLLCNLARILSSVSGQMSPILLSLIAVDRLLVIQYPYGQVMFKQRPTFIFITTIWIFAVLIAALPFMSSSVSSTMLTSSASVCLGFVLTFDASNSWMASVIIFIGGYFLTFFLTILGILVSQRKMTTLRIGLAGKIVSRTQDLRISKNLLLLGLINLLCWLPVQILGILGNTRVPDNYYVWIALFFFPLNSALNPFLYTLIPILRQQDFMPDLDEQDRQEFFTKEKLDMALDIWNDRRLLKGNFHSDKYRTLDDVLHIHELSLRDCIKILVRCLRCLKELHERDLVQDRFSLQDLFLRYEPDHTCVAFLRCLPRFTKSRTEKAANMKCFGYMVRQLFQKYDLTHQTSFKSLKTKVSQKARNISFKREKVKSPL